MKNRLFLDVSDLAVTDLGQTVRLGDYEAATAAILYGFDEEYRQRARKRQLDPDRALGAALRRLRLKKGSRRQTKVQASRSPPRTRAAIAMCIGVASEGTLT